MKEKSNQVDKDGKEASVLQNAGPGGELTAGMRIYIYIFPWINFLPNTICLTLIISSLSSDMDLPFISLKVQWVTYL